MTWVPAYHNWEDDSAVLVDITAPHTEDPVRRFGRRQGGERELYWLGVTVAGGMRGVRAVAVTVAGEMGVLKIFIFQFFTKIFQVLLV